MSGFVPARHAADLQLATGSADADRHTGEYVAGVRYRAWKPWSALHPTLEIDSPLTFDLVDRATGGLAGRGDLPRGASGRAGVRPPPVNAYEAEARRHKRFEAMGHTTGMVDVEALDQALAWRAAEADEFPVTLDLRRRRPQHWGRG